ncbi:MAG: hypothetical protein JWN53_2356 [Gemmatimonadetes bacterium]|jgi:hypothetical protein|nr:hypothetical protein [Gemmatimonadota bacterium]
MRRVFLTLGFALVIAAPHAVAAQDSSAATPAAVPTPPLFRRETPLAVTFTTNIGKLRRERDDKAPWHASTLSYTDSSGTRVIVPVRAKTHGVWRLNHCQFPPVRLNFRDKETKQTLFHHLEKPKLVNFCRDMGTYEQYILQEFQLYRAYQLLSPVSHRARLLRITYVDSGETKEYAVRYGFIIEDPEQLAERLHGRLLKVKGAGADDIDPAQGAITYLFQYFIGNTDFSFTGLHNGELIGLPTGTNLPVAYDFDFSGAVNATYASVDPRIRATSVRQRVFRGYCEFHDQYPAAAALFREKKDAIYALYRDEIGRLMDQRIVEQTLRYFDEFYESISTDQQAERDVFSRCIGPRSG